MVAAVIAKMELRVALLLLALVVCVAGQPFSTCINLCTIGGPPPGQFVNCTRDPLTLLNSAAFQGVCGAVQPTRANADTLCGTRSDPVTSSFLGTATTPCEWNISNMTASNAGQLIFVWDPTRLADFGDAPTLTFVAVVTNPPPPVLEVSLSSYNVETDVLTDCKFTTDLVAFNVNGGQLLTQPRTYTYPFTVAQCGAAFNPHKVVQFKMLVSSSNFNPTLRNFRLLQSSVPPGPCFTSNNCPAPDFTVQKVVNGGITSVNAVGQAIPYLITIVNTGLTNLTAMSVTDARLPGLTCAPTAIGGTLLPVSAGGAPTVCTGTYLVTQADLNAGVPILNTVSVNFPELGPKTANASVAVQQQPQFTLSKTTSASPVSAALTVVPFTITVTNNGNVALNGFQLSDPLLNNVVTCTEATPNVAGASSTLQAGRTAVCTGSYTVTQADMNRGTGVVNTVTVQFTNGPQPRNASVTVPIVPNPCFTVAKTNNLPLASTVGQVIAYEILIQQCGNQDLTNMTVTDALLINNGGVTCPQGAIGGTLAVASPAIRCTGQYVVTQTDLNTAATITNNVTVTFTQLPQGRSAQSITRAAGSPGVRISKRADREVVDAANQVITYTIQVDNTGNVDLANTTLSDARLNPAGITCQNGFSNGQTLRVGQSAVCTGRYTTTSADILAGVPLVNTASVTTARTSAQNATASVNVRQTAMFTISKTTTITSVNAAGQAFPFEIRVTNTGNLRLTQFALNDSLVASNTLSCTPTLGSALGVNATAVCTGSYTVTQANINAGVPLVNVASAQFAEIGAQSAQVSVQVVRTFALEISKQGSPTTVSAANTPIRYTIVVSNTGNADLTGVQFSDPLITVSGDRNLQCNPPLGSTLGARATVTCQGSYTVTQTDLDTVSQITNTATVSALELQTPRIASATTQLQTRPAATLTKTASLASVDAANTPIVYTVTVTNTGNVQLRNMTVVDELAPLSCNAQGLAPGAVATCTGSYTVTAADMTAGLPITNVVKVAFSNLAQQEASVTTTLVQRPSFTLRKTANTASVTSANQRITYSIVVTNTGNVALQQLRVVDPRLPSMTCVPFAANGASALPTAQSTTCTGVYVTTQDDINAGAAITNTATASVSNTGVGPQTDTVTIPVQQTVAFSLSKVVDKPTTNRAGDVLQYVISVANLGNVELKQMAIVDVLLNANTLTCTPVAINGTLGVLSGSSTTTCRGAYTVTQNDINLGASIVNTVLVRFAGAAEQTARATTTVAQNRALRITKVANTTSVNATGQSVLYTITVSNVGNVDLNTLSVTDTRLTTGLACAPVTIGGTLTVGNQTVCTGTYLVKQTDINAGTPLTNTASASANNTATVTAAATVNVQQNAMMTAVKTVDPTGSVTLAGTVLRYNITITNTGNEDLASLSVLDPLLDAGTLRCDPVGLNQTLTVVARTTLCTGTYTVKQSDINTLPSIRNVAQVSTRQAGPLQVEVTTPIVRQPSITIRKEASLQVVSQAGQRIQYTVTVANTGNTDLANTQIIDPLIDANANDLVCQLNGQTFARGQTLPTRQTLNCVGSYTVTQAVLNSAATGVVNVAAVTTNQTARTEASVTTTITRNPALFVTKIASVSSVNAAGQPIVYTITVRNLGNIDLEALVVSDSRLPAPLVCSPVPVGSTLTVGNQTVCTGTYIVRQSDINSGTPLLNTVSASSRQTPQAVTASATVTVQQRAALAITKVANRETVNAADQLIGYTIRITNVGNTDLSSLQLSDTLLGASLGALTCQPVALGQTLTVQTGSTTCTGSYRVTIADMNAGGVLVNTAVAQATNAQPVQAQARVAVQQRPSFTIAKTVDTTVATAAGQTLRYSIIVRNTGNIDLRNFQLDDPLVLAAGGNLSCSAPFGSTLAVSAPTVTCTGAYVVTQGDINAAVPLVNTASARFQGVEPASATATTSIAGRPALAISKRADRTTVSVLGEVVTYSIVVSNIGNQDLPGLTVVDTRVTGLSCADTNVGGILRVGANTTCRGTYTVTQADLNAGAALVNTATATSSLTTTPVTAIANVGITQRAQFNVSKTASRDTATQAGQVVQYTINIVNSGNEDLTGLRVLDPLVTTGPNGANDLRCVPVEVGGTLTVASERTVCTGSYTVSQSDIDSGATIENRVTVSFNQTGAQSAVANTAVLRSPSFSITKEVDRGSATQAGQTLRYTIQIRNTGNTRLRALRLDDFLVDTGARDMQCTPVAPGPLSVLDVGATTTCRGSYVVTQADVNAGTPITNTATAIFTEAGAQSASATTTVTQSPTFTIAKTTDRTTVDGARQLIRYTITVVNTGTVDLTQLQVLDPLVTTAGGIVLCTPVAQGATLLVGRTTVCSGNYTTTQANINAGLPILNTATARFFNAPAASADVSTAVTQRSSLAITKSANRPNVTRAGDVVGYSIVVSNTGNVDLDSLQVTDSIVDATQNDLRCAPTAEGATLQVGASTTCTGTYVATQSDINSAATIVNTATAVGGNAALVSAQATVRALRTVNFSVNKRANVQQVDAAGNVIQWTMQIVNTGNADLVGLVVSDPLIDGQRGDVQCTPVAVGGTLSVASRTTTCTGSYQVTQDDLNTRTIIVNNVTASFSGSTDVAPMGASASVRVVPSPRLNITKIADVTLVDSPGDVITYTITVVNSGNVDLPQLRVSDPRITGSSLACGPTAQNGTLLVGASTACVGTYITTQADVNAAPAAIVNTASAVTARTAAVTAQASVQVRGSALFTVTKTASLAEATAANQTIVYTVSITNTGTVDLDNLQVGDALLTANGGSLTCAPVAPGQRLTVAQPNTICTGTYRVTQADMDAGAPLVNTVVVNTTQVRPRTATATTTVVQQPSLSIDKRADLGAVSAAGTVITYSIVVTNNGNIGLRNFQLRDELVERQQNGQLVQCTPVTQSGTLAVGAQTTCRATFRVTQSDMNAGASIVNTATATAFGATPVSSSATTRVLQNAAVSISKTGDLTEVNAANRTIAYVVRVVNTGNVDLVNLQVDDALVESDGARLVCFPVAQGATLPVGVTSVCSGAYTTSQADINAGGFVVNQAIVTTVQTQPQQAVFSTRVVQRPLAVVRKVADRPSVSRAGDMILYTITVSNGGNVDLSGLQIEDALIDSTTNNLVCAPVPRGANLLVNQTTTCRGSYITPQSVINVGGVVVNRVVVRSTEAAPVDASVSTPVLQLPSLSVVKTADRLTVNTAGQIIRYTVQLNNTGNVDLNNVQVFDSLIDGRNGDVVCTPVSNGQTLTVAQPLTTCTGTYTVTQADVNAGGMLKNVASVTATQLARAVSSEAATVVARNARVVVTKTAEPATATQLGETVRYTVTISNAGNVDLDNLVVADAGVDAFLTCGPVVVGSTLRVGQTTVCTGARVVTQAILDAALPIVNVVTVSTVQSGAVTAMATVNVVNTAALTVSKTASLGQVERAGAVIVYSIVVRNAGNTVLTNFRVTDALVPVLACTPVSQGQSLSVAGTTTCVGNYTVKQSDMNSLKAIVNSVSVQTGEAGPVRALATTTIVQQPSFTVQKSADRTTVSAAGQRITYTVQLRNTGNVDLTNVNVNDAMLGSTLQCPGTTLLVSQPVMTCTGGYVVTMADMNAGADLVNVVSVNTNQFGPQTATAVVTVTQTRSLRATKTANVSSVFVAGTPIGYTVVVINTGNVELDNLRVVDSRLATQMQCAPVQQGSTLGVGGTTTCTGFYRVTQADFNAMQTLVNTATVTAALLTDPVTVTASVAVRATATFTVSKQVDRALVTQAGQQLLYTIIVRNTGNTDLPGFSLTDALAPQLTCTPVSPGETLTVAQGYTNCTTAYVTTQADLNRGGAVVNSVTASFATSAGPLSANATSAVVQSLRWTVEKSADYFSVNAAGQVVRFTIIINNVGNVDIPQLSISDPLVPQLQCNPPFSNGQTLPVADGSRRLVCVGLYNVTQADIDRGTNIVNVASVTSGSLPAITANATVFLQRTSQLAITKVADTNLVTVAGTVIRYTITVRNAGNTAVGAVTITDSLTRVSCNGTALPLTSPLIVCTANYTVTEADLARGTPIVNTATASASGVPTVSASASVALFGVSQFTVQKQAQPTIVSAAGANITYSVVVANTGTNVLANMSAVDPLIPGLACTPVAQGGSLAPRQSTICTGTYRVTAADVTAGRIDNTATVRFNGLAPASATATVVVNSQPVFTVRKTATPASVTGAGQTVQYTVTVANVGTIDLPGLQVFDPLLTLTCTPVATGNTLPVGATTQCRGTYTVTAADVARGSITNTATVTLGSAVTRTASAVVLVSAAPPPGALRLEKTGSPSQVSTAGSVITYTLVATNTGAQPLLAVTISDPTIASLTCLPVPNGRALAAGQSTTCTGQSVVSQSQINAGVGIVNNASVRATDASGANVTATASFTVAVGQLPQLSVVKAVSPAQYAVAGQLLRYTVTIRNTGNVVFSTYTVQDALVQLQCSPTSIAPFAVATCNGTYAVTQADVLARVPIVNTVSVTVPALGLSQTASVSAPISNQGQLVFQFVLLNGTLQFVATREVVDLSRVQVIVTDSLGVPQLFNLTASGFLVGLFEPGPATVSVVESTLPAGVSLVAGSNPTRVTIPTNGIVQGSIVFSMAPTTTGTGTTAPTTGGTTGTTTPQPTTTTSTGTTGAPTTAPPTPPPPPTAGSVTEINFFFKDILAGAGVGCGCGCTGGQPCPTKK